MFICQNNGWAEHTPLDEFAPVTDLAERAKAYGLTAVAVDGFDALATWAVFRDAVARARSGGGPTFVECRTYRLTGHVGTGDYSYMPEDVVAAATQRDPVPAFRGLLPDAQADEIDERAAQTVEEAFTFAYESPPPDPGELYRDVFADESLVPRS